MTGIEIQPLTADRAAEWDVWVRAHPEGTFFHLAGWREVIRRAFGHRDHYLLATQGGRIRGLLPLFQVRSLLFGHALISTPFCVYGGVLAEDAAVAEALEGAAVALAERLRVDYLELRNRQPRHPDWPTKTLYVTFRKQLADTVEANLKAVPRKQRAMIRKGMEAGLVAETDRDIDRFYAIYAASVRALGTPVFGRRYFRLLREVFGDDCGILHAVHDGRPIASVMSFYFRDEVLPYYGGGLPEARRYKGYDFMYWALMRSACEAGYRVFDYGRSKQGTGSYRFKKHWGFEPEPLYYEYHLVRAREMPDISPANPKYERLIAIWKRLPLAVTRVIGPPLARYLG